MTIKKAVFSTADLNYIFYAAVSVISFGVHNKEIDLYVFTGEKFNDYLYYEFKNLNRLQQLFSLGSIF